MKAVVFTKVSKIKFSFVILLLIQFLSMGNRASASTTSGNMSLLEAVKSRNEAQVKELIASKSALSDLDESGNGALHIIAKEGHYKFPPAGIPKILIDSGIDIDSKNSNGATALEISLLSGWQKVE